MAAKRWFNDPKFIARLAIAFKGLPFKTEWIEMCDIEATMKKLGAEATTTKRDGSPKYTLPTIFDDTTRKFVSESMKISEYLEATYPDKPSLFPFGAHAPIHLFNAYVIPTAIEPAYFVFTSGTLSKLNPPTVEYLRKTLEPVFNKKLEEMTPQGETRAAQLAAAKEGFSKLASIYSSNGGGKPYFYGDVPSYADVLLAAHLLWIMVGMGPDSPEWNSIEEWDDGRWGNLVKLMKKYYVLA